MSAARDVSRERGFVLPLCAASNTESYVTCGTMRGSFSTANWTTDRMTPVVPAAGGSWIPYISGGESAQGFWQALTAHARDQSLSVFHGTQPC